MAVFQKMEIEVYHSALHSDVAKYTQSVYQVIFMQCGTLQIPMEQT